MCCELTDYTEEDHDLLTKKYCETLAIKLGGRVEMLPDGCKDFASVEALTKKCDVERHDNAIAFAGMHNGEALAASESL